MRQILHQTINIGDKKMKALKTLAKELDFCTEIEYFDYCINCYYNGNFEQSKDLFKAMKKQDRKNLILYIAGCYDIPESKAVYKFYFNLI